MTLPNTLPTISVIIPTLNSEKVLPLCLQSIRDQNYPSEKIEIIIVDAGSKDNTIYIAKKYGVKRFFSNPLTTGEAGKAIGINHAKNELIALIDSDNILEGRNWFKQMVEPFQQNEINFSEPLYWTYRKQDNTINRYCSLTGINDPLCLFIGNYDRYSYLFDDWTNYPYSLLHNDGYLIIKLNKTTIPTMGANGFIIKRSFFKEVPVGKYFFDIDFMYDAVNIGHDKIARPKIGIIHLFCSSPSDFVKKTRRRIRDYIKFRYIRSYPWSQYQTRGVLFFSLYTITFIPLLIQSIIGYRRKPDRAWFYHPILCLITFVIYVFGFRSLFSKKQ